MLHSCLSTKHRKTWSDKEIMEYDMMPGLLSLDHLQHVKHPYYASAKCNL